jgi:sec-independent protein translocase protein TatB
MLNIAKFFRSFKTTIADAKSSIEQEINIAELKKEAIGFKDQLTAATNEVEKIKGLTELDFADIDNEQSTASTPPTAQTKESPAQNHAQVKADLPKETSDKQSDLEEVVTFKKKKKKNKTEKENISKEETN